MQLPNKALGYSTLPGGGSEPKKPALRQIGMTKTGEITPRFVPEGQFMLAGLA
jgi:hypothetical protein